VTIAAGLHTESGGGRAREVGGHNRRGAAQKRERRLLHAPVADRQQLGDAVLIKLAKDRDRVGAIDRGLPFPVTAARHLLAQGAAGHHPCSGRQCRRRARRA
jgi:hypothetical protein